MCLRAPRSTLFPYTTLFRSIVGVDPAAADAAEVDLADGIRRAGDAPRTARDGISLARGCEPSQSLGREQDADRKSTRLNSSHSSISYAVFCLKKKTSTTKGR